MELRGPRQKLASLRLLRAAELARGSPFRRHVDDLQKKMLRARELGLEQEKLADAVAILSWAELNIQEEVCDICYSAVEIAAMPCCGRETGGGRICSACESRM